MVLIKVLAVQTPKTACLLAVICSWSGSPQRATPTAQYNASSCLPLRGQMHLKLSLSEDKNGC